MSGSRRAGRPIVAVLVTSALLLGGARWLSRVAASRAPEGAGAAGTTQKAAAAPDLTFYATLGDAAPVRGKAGAKGGETALRAAPGDIVPAEGIYVVQVASGGNEERAKRVRDRLLSKGLPAAVMQDDDGGLFRVRVGRWKDRAPAEVMAERIRKDTGLQVWVLREGER